MPQLAPTGRRGIYQQMSHRWRASIRIDGRWRGFSADFAVLFLAREIAPEYPPCWGAEARRSIYTGTFGLAFLGLGLPYNY